MAIMKDFPYNLPRGYLSYSAAMLWQRNKAQFRSRYYEREKQEETVPMAFGKKIADILEYRHWNYEKNDWDFGQYDTLKKVPYYPISEQPLTVNVDGVFVKGYLDLFNPKKLSIAEVKTGSVSHTSGPPWDDVKVAKHDQLPWYSFLVKQLFGGVDDVIKLIWIETRYKRTSEMVGSRMMEGESRELELTGKVQTFKRKIDEWERKRMKQMIITTAQEITHDFNNYLKSNDYLKNKPVHE